MACVPSIVAMARALFFAQPSVEQHHLHGIVSTAAAQIPALGSVTRHRLLDVG
jgi:hypothetical protein